LEDKRFAQGSGWRNKNATMPKYASQISRRIISK